MVLIVPILSFIENLSDETCILSYSEHPFLKHKSFVSYRNARVERADQLENGVAQGLFLPHEELNGQTFLRVRNGVCKSEFTAKKIKQYFGC
jgi:hypothetical protein